jgi:hypothetical protein
MKRGPHSEALHEDERRADEVYDRFHAGELDEEYGRFCRLNHEPLSEEFLADYQEREAHDGG